MAISFQLDHRATVALGIEAPSCVLKFLCSQLPLPLNWYQTWTLGHIRALPHGPALDACANMAAR